MSSQNDIEIENKFDQGLGIIKLKNLQSPFQSFLIFFNLKFFLDKTGVYRFFANLIEPEFFNPQYIKLYVINEKEVNLFEVPKTPLKDIPKNWDIGLIVGKILRNFFLKLKKILCFIF